jgi:hypothetical protein
MRSWLPLITMSIVAGCSMPPPAVEPSLAPRAAEAIDPRLPIADIAPTGSVDPSLAARLQAILSTARAGVPAFEARAAEASRLAAEAGPIASESWVAAEQILSRLVEQYGVTTRAMADIDALASDRLNRQHWIQPADREAIAVAAAELAAIGDPQAATIARLKNQLAR